MTSRSLEPTRSTRRRVIGAPLVLTVVLLTQCVCQNARKDEAPAPAPAAASEPASNPTPAPAPEAAKPAVKLPARLDVGDLDDDEKALLAEVLNEQFDPCGEPRSFLDSLSAATTCDLAISLGDHTVMLIAKGLSKKQIVRQLLKELARATSKADFRLEDTPHIGDPKAENVLVEFMDFQCPFCKLAAGPAKDLAKQYGAVLYIKHLPLTQHHPHAEGAALAAIAADRQGKFWPVYEGLFDAQERLDADVIRQVAKDAGCDMARFDADVASAAVKKLLERDVEDADRAQADGTPMFYLNGYVVEFDQIEQKLRDATVK